VGTWDAKVEANLVAPRAEEEDLAPALAPVAVARRKGQRTATYIFLRQHQPAMHLQRGHTCSFNCRLAAWRRKGQRTATYMYSHQHRPAMHPPRRGCLMSLHPSGFASSRGGVDCPGMFRLTREPSDMSAQLRLECETGARLATRAPSSLVSGESTSKALPVHIALAATMPGDS
jgi:hypothetical protein